MPQPSWSPSTTQQLRKLVAAPYLAPNDWTPRSEAYFVFPLAQGTPGKQCGLAATGVYQPSLRSPWLAAVVKSLFWRLLRESDFIRRPNKIIYHYQYICGFRVDSGRDGKFCRKTLRGGFSLSVHTTRF
ncbi:hypothetical protein, partial [Thiolapillus sp.]|uniref:hypothetical protein n=1 Tax=Thiolapillus sp. TaxID=2017437 RepID=UPI003AF4CDB2